ncbi:MAG: DNA primase [Planctomycetes bacterium]|nr:DNA primase [Planctomycetota bacterium]
MGLISRDSIEEVRRAADIVEVISQLVPLKKTGAAYWACCPFHQEKTPSFQVSPQRQTFKCFGCGAYGNAISFLTQYEKLSFPEAAEKLAGRYGVKLRYEGGGPSKQERDVKDRALAMLETAQKFFRYELGRCEPAKKYLHDRQLDGDVAERWGIGYAPDEWQRLTDVLRDRFRDDAAMEASGAVKKNDQGRWFDFFRGRVTFPIKDARGRVVGFGARLLDPDAKAQKYLNSAEGPLFSKSKLLYALDKLSTSKRAKETGRALIMEGYTDVIAAHEAGFDNAVAPLGTALTIDQVHLLKRYCEGITIVLDGDAAGLKGAERALNLVLEAGADANVVVIPDEMDPFDLIRAKGPEAFGKLLEKPQDAFDFKLTLLRGRHDFNRPVEAEAALGELAETIARAPSATLRELYARKAAAALGLRERNVLAAVEAAHGKQRVNADRDQGRAENAATRDSVVGSVVAETKNGPASAREGAARDYERDFLRRLLQHPRALGVCAESLPPEALSRDAAREIYREMLNAWDERGECHAADLISHMGEAARAELAEIMELVEVTSNQAARADAEQVLQAEIRTLASRHHGGDQKGDALQKLRQSKGKRARKSLS